MSHVKQASRYLGVGAFAFFATNALLSLAKAQDFAHQSIPFLLLYALIAWEMWALWDKKPWEKQRRRITAATLALAFCFSAFTIVGKLLNDTDRLIFSPRQAMDLVGMVSLLFMMLWRFFHWASRNGEKTCIHPRTSPFRLSLFCFLSLGLSLCWLPAFLSLFPGVVSPDSLMQMYQAVGFIPLNNGHPVLHTLLIAACVKVGQFFGIHITTTPALYGLAQMLFMSTACAYSTVSMLRMKIRPLFVGLVYAFFALYPVNAVYSVTMWKDIPHAGVTLLLVTCLLQWTRDPKGFFGSRARVVSAILLLFLFSTLRHNALFAYLFFIPFFLWRFRNYWKRALLVCLSVFALIGIYRAGLSLLKVIPAQFSETLSVPMQFAARVVQDHRDTLPAEEEEILREILPVDELPQLYMPRLADPIKYRFDSHAFEKDPGRYIAMFARLIPRYPATFAESFLLGNYGYWYPEASYWILWYGVPENDFQITRRSILFSEDLYYRLEAMLKETPGLSMLFSIGITAWILALAAAICWVNRRNAWPPFSLLLGLWLTLLFMPVFAEYRYAYALVLCAPVCLCAMLGEPSDSAD